MTYQLVWLTHETHEVLLEVSHERGEERGLNERSLFSLQSGYGNVEVKTIVTDIVVGDEVYLPMNDQGDGAINLHTSTYADKDTDTPAYKEVSAKMSVLGQEDSPLPKHNFRYGNRQPQMGVNVEAKWARDDYTFPGDL